MVAQIFVEVTCLLPLAISQTRQDVQRLLEFTFFELKWIPRILVSGGARNCNSKVQI